MSGRTTAPRSLATGPGPNALLVVDTVEQAGFDTRLDLPANAEVTQVRALDADGEELGRSLPADPRPRGG